VPCAALLIANSGTPGNALATGCRDHRSQCMTAKGLSDLAGRIILASMSALLSPVQDGKIWRVKIVWPNRAVHHFGKFISEQDAIDWINAHPRLTKPEDMMD
jgi:hypothetical protein